MTIVVSDVEGATERMAMETVRAVEEIPEAMRGTSQNRKMAVSSLVKTIIDRIVRHMGEQKGRKLRTLQEIPSAKGDQDVRLIEMCIQKFKNITF